jgi:hypothetical protein
MVEQVIVAVKHRVATFAVYCRMAIIYVRSVSLSGDTFENLGYVEGVG